MRVGDLFADTNHFQNFLESVKAIQPAGQDDSAHIVQSIEQLASKHVAEYLQEVGQALNYSGRFDFTVFVPECSLEVFSARGRTLDVEVLPVAFLLFLSCEESVHAQSCLVTVSLPISSKYLAGDCSEGMLYCCANNALDVKVEVR